MGNKVNNSVMSNKPKILIVEDEIEDRKYLQLVLKKKYDLDFCDTKKSVFSLLSEKKYDVVIMDISLKPDYSGIDLIKDLKRKPAYKNIPIICLSAHAYGEDKRKAQELGADIYLTKPVTNKVLLSTVEKLIVSSTNKETKA